MSGGSFRWCVRAAVLLLIVLSVSGCLRRTVTINSEPQGARVVLNDRELGTTPITVPFTYYGDYDVVLRKQGYQTLHTNHVIPRPWHQYPPIDLITESLLPFDFRDEYEVAFALEPADPPSPEELREHAKALREKALYTDE